MGQHINCDERGITGWKMSGIDKKWSSKGRSINEQEEKEENQSWWLHSSDGYWQRSIWRSAAMQRQRNPPGGSHQKNEEVRNVAEKLGETRSSWT